MGSKKRPTAPDPGRWSSGSAAEAEPQVDFSQSVPLKSGKTGVSKSVMMLENTRPGWSSCGNSKGASLLSPPPPPPPVTTNMNERNVDRK